MYGSQSASADMKTLSIAIGSPESALCYKYAALMADYYGIPCRAGGALSDAKVLDAQCGFESLLTYLACEQSGVELVMQGAGVLNSYLDLSFEKIVCDFEIIDFVDKYLGDIAVDEETVPLETIDEVGQSGSYVMADHTLDNYLDALIVPELCARGTVGSDHFATRVEQRIGELVSSYKRPERTPEQVQAMRAAATAFGIEESYLDMLDKELDK